MLVCGKNENVAKLLDFLGFTVKSIAKIIIDKKIDVKEIDYENVAKLLDFLGFTVKSIAKIIIDKKIDVKEIDYINHAVLRSLFVSITNANFDEDAIIAQIKKIY